MMRTFRHAAAWMMIAGLLLSLGMRVEAQYAPDTLKQMVAPIALYPDSLAMQVLIASCYPQEVVEADRWVRSNPGMNDPARVQGLAAKTWDPSVSSLTAFPDLLSRMAANLDWTKALGEAFLSQQKDVLAAVQAMRAMAQQSGSLATSPQQVVSVDQGNICIASASPSDVYLPYYDPTAVYGASWSYPSWQYPGVMAPWAGYAAGRALAYGTGVAVGNAMYATANWASHSVGVNANYSTYPAYRGAATYNNVTSGTWTYNQYHRQGVNYTNPALRTSYGSAPTYNSAAATRGYGAATTPAAGAQNRYWSGSQVSTPGISNSAFQQNLNTQRAQTQAAERGAASMGGYNRGGYQGAAGAAGRPANMGSYGGYRGGGGGYRGGGGRR